VSRSASKALLRLWGASLAIIVVGVAAGLGAYLATDREAVIAGVSDQALYDATLAAMSLESVLQKAAAEVGRAARGGGVDAEALRYAAFGIGEAENVYVLDGTGAIMATAYRRLEPRIYGLEGALDRLGSGSGAEARILDAPSEGGKALALVACLGRGDGGAQYAAVIFREASVLGSIPTIGSAKYASLGIRDRQGGEITVIGSDTGRSAPRPTAIGVEVPLARMPLSVVVKGDVDVALRDWYARLVILSALVSLFAAVLVVVFVVGTRLSDQAESAEALRSELDKREVLFKEINHRVKNNLIIVMSVLRFGADAAAAYPEKAVLTLESAIDRVRAIALLHETLYKKAPEARDDFGAYLTALAESLSEAYGRDDRVRVDESHSDGIRLGLDKTVPLALMINEIVTNAYKHAFPDGRRGTIRIRAATEDKGGIYLRVDDDGIGTRGDGGDGPGIGTMLLSSLGEQLEATIERSEARPSGTSWSIRVPKEGRGSPLG